MRLALASICLIVVLPLGGCQRPPSEYLARPDIKVLASPVGSDEWYYFSNGCNVKRTMQIAVAECQARSGANCEPIYVGPYSVRGKSSEELKAIQETYLAEYERNAARSDAELRSEFFHFVAAFDRKSGNREIDSGTMNIVHSRVGCESTIGIDSARRRCAGQIRYGELTPTGRLFPQFGAVAFECDDGTTYAGEYVLTSFQYGRAEMTGTDGTSVRTIFSTSSAVADMTATGFDEVWNRGE